MSAVENDRSFEIPMFLASDDGTLFGILTRPPADDGLERGAITVVSLPGGGTPLGMNVNALSVRLSRRLAGEGLHTFRLDYHGSGDSTGASDRFHLATPFTDDASTVLEALRARGLGPFVLVGDCFGGRTALAIAERTAEEDILAIVLISAPIRDFEFGERMVTSIAAEPGIWPMIRRSMRVRHLKGLFSSEQRRLAKALVTEKLQALSSPRAGRSTSDSRYRISANFTRGFECLRRRRTPTLVVYGQDEDLFDEFSRQRAMLADTIDDPDARIELVTVPGTLHGFTELAAQDRVLDLVAGWITRLGKDDPSSRSDLKNGCEVG